MARFPGSVRFLLVLLFAFVFACPAQAARIGDVTDTNAWEQALRFFTFRDDGLRVALAGCMLLGLNCGLLGGFIVVRRLSLVGDTLSHAVLPGVALGFMWNMTKDPVAILIAATLVGALAMLVVNVITRTTKLKQDTALGLVLSSFFAVGLCLMSLIQPMVSGNKSGLDKFFFGQAAAVSEGDLWLLSGTTVVSLAFLALCYRGLLTLSFHRGYGETLGLPMSFLHHALMLFTSFAVVT
ncbi:MAG TPA: metal ABC transporter permease, partial [Candidatus Saccharimonadia bacterium]|nr:metal ABC transporter permease [Candidatus Saccharimonadia bacterium]